MAAGTCSPSTPQYCPAPSVTTGSATAITSHSVVLNGSAIPNGAPTTCTFAYGPTTSYGSFTKLQTIGSGSTAVAVAAPIDGLGSSTGFHFQLVCNSAGGLSFGGDRTFTTADHGPSAIALTGGNGFSTSHGVAQVFLACFGDRTCRGTLTLTSGRRTVGRHSYSIRHNSSAVVSVRLSSSFRRTLVKRGRLKVRASAVDSDGPRTGATITLHVYR
jgi:hypothetical protein